ncbi:excinuclease ABC subunit UvrC [Anaplasmataceae bacterium AB001_6]|nr:excinuclease ABC subunit UvrC [Anaplasmataceae bacterium AB001_6]
MHNKIADLISLIPEKIGVYEMISCDDIVLYVGKAKNLKKRVSQYLNPREFRLSRMMLQVMDIKYILTDSVSEALILENRLIKSLKPKYNIQLKDDKSYPYIRIAMSHDYPRILKYRGVNLKDCYGPFSSVSDAQKIITVLRKSFRIRSCSDNFFSSRQKPCMEYQINRCTAPCVSKIDKKEYRKDINKAISVLKGNVSVVEKELLQQMHHYSEAQSYELAMKCRDSLRALHNIHTSLNSDIVPSIDGDSIGFAAGKYVAIFNVLSHRKGESIGNYHVIITNVNGMDVTDLLDSFLLQHYISRMLPNNLQLPFALKEESVEAIARIFNKKLNYSVLSENNSHLMKFLSHNATHILEKHEKIQNNFNKLLDLVSDLFIDSKRIIDRIEVYDNSHFAGDAALGVRIVVDRDGFNTKLYRVYKFEESEKLQDDYYMMRNVLTRRVKRESIDKGVFILIDGGLGHLSVAKDVLSDSCYYACIAKGINRNAGEEILHFIDGRSLKLEKSDELLYFLQSIRDESHRFAISNNRKNLIKSTKKSVLDKISGVGPKKKRILLSYFGSVEEIMNAKQEQIATVPSIGSVLAQKIYNFLHAGGDK